MTEFMSLGQQEACAPLSQSFSGVRSLSTGIGMEGLTTVATVEEIIVSMIEEASNLDLFRAHQRIGEEPGNLEANLLLAEIGKENLASRATIGRRLRNC